MFLIFFDIYLEVEMLGHMVTVHLIKKNMYLFIWLCWILVTACGI